MGPDLIRADLAAFLPWFGLRIAHRGLVLVPPTDVELLELAEIVAEPGGIDEAPDDPLAFLRGQWALRVPPRPGHWTVPFAVLLDGRALGVATLATTGDDGVLVTGGWLARAGSDAALDRRVRLLLLELVFAHLDATRALTSAPTGAAGLPGVPVRPGHREGATAGRAGAPASSITPGVWRRRRLGEVEVDGVGPFRAAITPG